MTRSHQRGFSLFEAVIGLAIAAMMVAWAISVRNDGIEQEDGRTRADELSSFIQLSTQYVMANRTSFEAAMEGTDAATYCKVNVNADGTGGVVKHDGTLKTCAFDASHLRANGVWPSSMGVEADEGGRYVAIWRKIYNAGSPTGAIEALVVHASPAGVLTPVNASDFQRRSSRLTSGMATLGGSGGFVPIGEIGACKSERASNTFQACGSAWTVDLSKFVSSAELTTFANALPN